MTTKETLHFVQLLDSYPRSSVYYILLGIVNINSLRERGINEKTGTRQFLNNLKKG